MSHLLKKASFCGAGETLFLNEDLSDVTIIIKTGGSPWRFPAHSLLLSAQSVVFRCMLGSDFAERKSRQIIIEDISPTTMEQLLRYIYYGKPDLENWKEAIELLRAAHKYQVEPLVQRCGRFLEDVISLSNVCYVYNEATTYTLVTLKEKCLKLILDAGFVVLRSKTFETLSKESVMEIVTNSNLNVDSELIVFDALLRWAPMECCRTGKQVTETNILSVLEPFLQHVCFDDMSDTDKSALPSSILSCVRPNNRNRIGFSVLDSLLPYSHKLNFDSVQEGFIYYIGDSLNCVRFSVSTQIYLIGLRFVIMSGELPQNLPLTLIKENAGRSTVFTYNLASALWTQGLQINQRYIYDTQVLLRHPVLLEAMSVYRLYAVERNRDVACAPTRLAQDTIFTTQGHVKFHAHSESICGVASLIFI